MVSCRPQCRWMVYRQVIYDLPVAGIEMGDTRLSLQINKLWGPHHHIPACLRNNRFGFFFSPHTALSFGGFVSACFFSSFFSLCTHFTTILLCDPPLISYTLISFHTQFFSHLWLSLSCPLSQQDAGEFDMPAILYRNIV